MYIKYGQVMSGCKKCEVVVKAHIPKPIHREPEIPSNHDSNTLVIINTCEQFMPASQLPLSGKLSLLAQLGSRGAGAAAVFRAPTLLHIGSPECSADGVGKAKEDSNDRDEFEEDSGDTEAAGG